jgi:predicted dehydrogenase
MKKIKVGLIRCDVHAIYFGLQMFPHDPIEVRNDFTVRGNGVYLYLYLDYTDPRHMTAPQVSGFELARVWDADEKLAARTAELFGKQAVVCRNFKDVSDGVDLVFIADCNGDGSDHLALAAPGIRKRIPTFIDKPFARDAKDARALVALAKKRRTPIMSLSILREAPHAARFRERFDEIGPVMFGTISGGGGAPAGQIHAISLAQHIFGAGVKSVATVGGTEYPYHAFLSYKDGKHAPSRGVVLNLFGGGGPHGAFYASAYGPQGVVHSPEIGDFAFPYGSAAILRKIKRMVQTGKPQASYEEIIENIAVLEAIWKAHKTGRPVALR